MGRLFGSRSSSNFQLSDVSIYFTSDRDNDATRGYIKTSQGLQDNERWDLISCDYGGNNYVAVRYRDTDHSYPFSFLYFEGLISSNDESTILTSLPTSDVSNVSNYSNANTRETVQVEKFGVNTNEPTHTMHVEGDSYLSGDVGIGLSSPSYKLHVAGDIAATGDVLALSDRRVKTNVRPIGIDAALARVLRMQGVTYSRSDVDESEGTVKKDRTHIGFVAQDLMEVVPEAVSHDVASDLYSVNYGNMVALMAEAIKGLNAKNEILAAENERIKAEQADMHALMVRMDDRLRRLEG
jgi:hypothetical protein